MNKKIVFILVGILVCIALVGGIVLVSLKGNKEDDNTQNNVQKVEVNESKDSKEDNTSKENNTSENSLSSIPMDTKNAEYNNIKKKAKVLKCSKEKDGSKYELEILYDADGVKAKGVHNYVILYIDDVNEMERRKKTLESNLSLEGWEYYKVQIIDNHVEYEYVSTDIVKLTNNAFYQKDLNWSIDYYEGMNYTCTVTDNYLN